MTITGRMIWAAIELYADRDQEGTWFDQFPPNYRIDGDIDVDKLAECLNEIIEKQNK